MARFDLVVIGSGPAGEKGAAQAAYFGKKVAVIERGPLGGSCANTGTLPSKTLRETALFLSGFRKRELFGVDVGLRDRVTVKDLLYREHVVREGERARVRENLRKHDVALIEGEASFVDANTIGVTVNGQEQRLEADKFLIATGSSPNRPAPYRFEEERIYDSDELVDMHMLPKSLAVIGAGVIGCEYACMFAALELPVTLVERHESMLPFLDHEIAASLEAEMRALKIDVRFGESVKECTVRDDGVTLVFESGQKLEVDAVLVAAGRLGNTQRLGLEPLGIKLDKGGKVLVNEHYQTALPHIYAAGDVIGAPGLASTSMEQGRIAMCHAYDSGYKQRLAPILPTGIYTIPEVSMAGETEESLRKKNVPYVVGKTPFSQNARGEIIGEKNGMLKLLFFAETMKLAGVHVIGEHASELVHIGLSALMLQADADLFIQTCFNYPTLAEAYKYATYDALQKRAAQALGAAVAQKTSA
jgi:NAD(P) transhydrogenase